MRRWVIYLWYFMNSLEHTLFYSLSLNQFHHEIIQFEHFIFLHLQFKLHLLACVYVNLIFQIFTGKYQVEWIKAFSKPLIPFCSIKRNIYLFRKKTSNSEIGKTMFEVLHIRRMKKGFENVVWRDWFKSIEWVFDVRQMSIEVIYKLLK